MRVRPFLYAGDVNIHWEKNLSLSFYVTKVVISFSQNIISWKKHCVIIIIIIIIIIMLLEKGVESRIGKI